jgi:hypothetical protein
MSFGYNPPVGVRGLQMLVNIWLKCFLTPKGSDPVNLSYGTDFTRLIGSNVTPEDARDVVLLAIQDCNAQIKAFQAKDTSLTATERLATCVLIEYTIDNTAPGFTAKVDLKNVANERLVVNLPAGATI